MKAVAAALLWLAVSAVWGQNLAPATAMTVVSKALPKGPTQNPLEPSGFGGLEPREGALPPPRPVGEEERVLRLEQGKWSAQGSRIRATNGVHAIYKGYDMFASEMDGDTQEQIFTLTGDVKVIGVDAVVKGRTVIVNFKDNTFKAIDGDVQMRPSFLGGKTLDDVYLRGGTANGTRREIWAYDSELTTCNLDDPHFSILSESSDIRVGKRMILRRVTIRILDNDILKLPYLSIPLEDRSDRYLPEVGQSQDEGYYVKFKYPIPLKGRTSLLDAKIDYFTKLGSGLGADYRYETRELMGYLRAYGLVGQQRTFTLDQSHQMRIGSLDLTVQNNFQKQNYLTSPENTMLNSRIGMSLMQKGAMTNLQMYRTSNESSDFRSIYETLSLADSRSIGRTRTNVDFTYSKNSSSFTGSAPVERSQLDVHFRGIREFSKGTAELEYQRSIPIGDTTNFYPSQDRTPVFSFRSDAARLLGRKWAETLPWNAELSVGEYGNPTFNNTGPERISRGNFDLNVSKPDRSERRLGLDMDLRYRQGIYSDDTAQYVLGYNASARYRLGRRTGLNVRYSYLQAHGFSPLQFDRTGRSNLASADLSFEPLRRVTIGAQTGYDFLLEEQQETAWQSIGTRFEWNPTDFVQLRSLSSYDTFSKSWSNTRIDFSWKAGGMFVAAGARYDGIRHTWGNANIYVDGFKAGRLKMSMLLAYNGYLRQFEARHFSFTYDLHCAEAIFQVIDTPVGFRPGTQYGFFIRLKAFPFNTPFGLGRSGQSFGIGTGRDGF